MNILFCRLFFVWQSRDRLQFLAEDTEWTIGFSAETKAEEGCLIKPFVPQLVYIEPQALEYPLGRELKEKFEKNA